MTLIANNKKAFHDFEIGDRFEAGISLEGSEVKAIRAGRVNLKDSFVRLIKGEAFLLNAHISYLNTANPHFRPDERRVRKLLLHKKELQKLANKTSKDGMTLVATKLYFNHKNLVKIQIALAKGKTLHDKRNTLKKKDQQREIAQAVKGYK